MNIEQKASHLPNAPGPGEGMYRESAEYDGGDHGKGAAERREVKAGAGPLRSSMTIPCRVLMIYPKFVPNSFWNYIETGELVGGDAGQTGQQRPPDPAGPPGKEGRDAVSAPQQFRVVRSTIPLRLEYPKIGRIDDAEIVADRIAEDGPVFRHLLAQETQNGITEVVVGRVAPIVRHVSMHQPP